MRSHNTLDIQEEEGEHLEPLTYLMRTLEKASIDERVWLNGQIDIALPTQHYLIRILSYHGIVEIERQGPEDYRIHVGEKNTPMVFRSNLKVSPLLTQGPWRIFNEDPPYDPKIISVKDAKGPYIRVSAFCSTIPLEVILYPPLIVNSMGWGFGGSL